MPGKRVKRRDLVSDDKMVEAITAARGLLSVAARSLGVSRETVYQRARRVPAVQAAIDEAREATLDVAEAALFKQAAAGEGWAVKYLLSTQGRARGYVERRELTGSDGGPLSVEVVRRVVSIPTARGADPDAD